MAVTWDSGRTAAGITLSGGNLTATNASAGNAAEISTFATASIKSGEKKYFEVLANTIPGTSGAGWFGIGFGNSSAPISGAGGEIGVNTHSVGVYDNGQVYYNSAVVTNIASFAATDVVCFAVDRANNVFWARTNNGNWNNSGTANPATNTGGIAISPTGDLFPGFSPQDQTGSATAKFASADWTYGAPSGFDQISDIIDVSVSETFSPTDTIYAYFNSLAQAWQPNAFLWFPQASGGGPTNYDVDITESGSASDSQSAALTAVGARTETFTATDAQTGVLAMVFTISESGSASDSTTGLMTAVGAVTESGSASDATSATQTLVGAVSESGSASDSTTGLMTAVGSVSEIAASADSQSSTGVLVGATTETSTITDTQTGGLAFSSAVTESGSAADSQSATQTLVGATSESGAASDSQSTALVAVGAVSESGSASDSQSGVLTMVFTTSEAGSASDSQSATYVLVGVVSEAGNAVDVQTTGGFISDSVTESASASDAQTGNLVIAVSCSESANADDTCNATGGTPVGGNEFRVGGPDVVENFIPPTVADLYEVKKRTK
ncbi:MAG TPA: hypothetical protein PLU52_05100 [Opitutaceae bacterium]|nr:hypothetical protein [Opitutaceae bacterium]